MAIAHVRVRTTEDAVDKVRALALKMGSRCVTTRPVGPGWVENEVRFASASAAKKFKISVQNRNDGSEIVTD